jgi:competence protein ComEC
MGMAVAEPGHRIEAGERALFARADGPPRDRPAVAARGVKRERRPALPTGWPRNPRAFRTLPRKLGRAAVAAAVLEFERGLAFLFAPVFMGIGAISYFSLGEEPALLPLLAGVAVLAPLSLATRSRPLLCLAMAALLFCVLGALFAKLETLRRSTPMLGGEISTLLTAEVAGIERLASGRVRLTLDVLDTARPHLRYAPDRVRVTARRLPDDVAPGAVVSGLVRLMPPSGPVRPGSYDFSFESFFDGVGASGFFLRDPVLTDARPAPGLVHRMARGVERFRVDVADRIAARIGGADGQIAAALMVGVRAGIPEEINEALRRSGIYHVISISGLHMALVAGTIMGLMRAGFALFPGFASRRPVKKLAAATALAGIALYLFVSGAEVAAQRSFIMLAVMLTAVLFDRAALTMRNLAISAIVVLVWTPHEAMGPSFQMSFAATAALVGAYAMWAQHRQRRQRAPVRHGLARRAAAASLKAVAGLAATSIVAGGATAIYSAYHFQQMPSLGLFTNLTAMPVVSVVVMPFGVLAALAMPFGLDGPFLDIMGYGIALTVAIASWFAERSPIDMVGAISPVAVVLVTLALVAATLTTTWLRLAALPLALCGGLLMLRGAPPAVLVSEDARLVGVGLGDGRIAVNRARPNQFTIENWKRAVLAGTVVKPGEASGFACAEGLCTVADAASGLVVAHAANAAAAARACAAALIVVDDATAGDICAGRAVTVTKRDLARRGGAAVFAEAGEDGRPVLSVRHAVSEPYRPWHEHRRFSREARGLPPYERKPAGQGAGRVEETAGT